VTGRADAGLAPSAAAARAAIDELEVMERAWLARMPLRPVHEHEMRASRYVVRVELREPVPDTIRTVLADAVRAQRSLLDSWSGLLAGNPTAFPVHESLPQFAQRSRKALAGMPDGAQASIEALQPYHAIGGYRNGALWLLRELAADPRIRLAAGGIRDGATMGVNTRRKVDLTAEPTITLGAFDAGAIVASVPARIVGPDPKLDLFFRADFTLAFDRDGPASGAEVVATLRTLHAHLVDVVQPALAAWLPR
jgi:hypothetical protein